MSLFVTEAPENHRYHRLGTFSGVVFYSSRSFPVNLFLTGAVGVVVSFLFAASGDFAGRMLLGLALGALIMASSLLHGLGHIVSSRLVNAPMASLIMTATVMIASFDDKATQSSKVHVGRSLGGPALNLIVGLGALLVSVLVVEGLVLLFFAIINLGFAGFTLLPIPSLDGAVLWRELRRGDSEA